VARAVQDAWSLDAWRVREVMAQLADGGWHPVEGLVRQHALSHRSVTDLLRQLVPWVETAGDRARVRADARAAVRAAFAGEAGAGGRPAWRSRSAAPVAEPAAVAAMAELMAGLPAPDRHLGHLSATPDTAVARARFLLDNYDLSRAAVLCLGDHDVTSLALLQQRPDLAVTVVDVDERILAFIDRTARARGCLEPDLAAYLPRLLLTSQARRLVVHAGARAISATGLDDPTDPVGHLLRLRHHFELPSHGPRTGTAVLVVDREAAPATDAVDYVLDLLAEARTRIEQADPGEVPAALTVAWQAFGLAHAAGQLLAGHDMTQGLPYRDGLKFTALAGAALRRAPCLPAGVEPVGR